MIDQELVMWAAKAVGGKRVNDYHGNMQYAVDGEEGYWRPLDDDGQALRLAVRLGLVVKCPVRQDGRDAAAVSRGSLLAQVGAGDPFDDTRRAIVMAAAQLGKHL